MFLSVPVFSLVALLSLLLWVIITLLPWFPWLTRESWDVESHSINKSVDLSDITVLIPARNEASVIGTTLQAIAAQNGSPKVVLIDDNSDDDTKDIATSIDELNIEVIENQPLKKGWSGKLWALENGRKHVETPYTLLLDADIKIQPGVISGLKQKLLNSEYSFVSLMAKPSLSGFWERLLMPAFIYFFKLLYPFRIANSESRLISAAAGGCILLRTAILEDIGGFNALKETLIDDCTLAKKTKEAGYNTWLGLTHSVESIRPYGGLKEIWNMVARTAYTQLHYSISLLLLCTLLMILAYIVPLIALLSFSTPVVWYGLTALFLMAITYLPTLRYYGLPLVYLLSMPLVGALFLAMTWTSAIRYWKGERMRWRGRVVTE